MTGNEVEALTLVLKNKMESFTFSDSNETMSKKVAFNLAINLAIGKIKDYSVGNISKEFIEILRGLEK